jgi:hypothetical protein
MNHVNILAQSVAEECRNAIRRALVEQEGTVPDPKQQLDNPTGPAHLLWMCDKIQAKVDDWPATRLHRWIGFIQCGMISMGLTDLDGARRIISEAKTIFAEDEDQDLKDHQDPTNPFFLDIGGEGGV